MREREVSLPPKNCIKRKNTERKSSVMKYGKFGYKFKAIFCPLTSGKDYATISPTKRKNFGGHEKSPVTRYCFVFCHGTIDYKGRTSQNSLLFTKRFDWFHSGAPGEARTHNNGVGGHDFIRLDYECSSPQTPLRALCWRKAQTRCVAAPLQRKILRLFRWVKISYCKLRSERLRLLWESL